MLNAQVKFYMFMQKTQLLWTQNFELEANLVKSGLLTKCQKLLVTQKNQ